MSVPASLLLLRWCNLIVAASNLYGLLPIYIAKNGYQLWMTGVVLSSTLMHLSEVKHGLPGISPFNRYSNQLLWLDRIAANSLVAFAVFTPLINSNFAAISYSMLYSKVLWLGLNSLALSEMTGLLISPKRLSHQIFFTVTHCLWHICAYQVCYDFLLLFNNIKQQ